MDSKIVHVVTLTAFALVCWSQFTTVESWKITTTNKACVKAMEKEIWKFKTAHDTCGSRYGTGEKLSDANSVCAMLCLHKEKGFINEDNEFSMEKWAQGLSEFYPELIFSRYSKFVADCVKRYNHRAVKHISSHCSEMKEFLKCYEMAELEACGYKEVE